MFSWIISHPWAYPVLELLHICGIALLLGNLVLFELRLLGLARSLPLAALARATLSLSLAGFGLAAFSGLLMFAGHPLELLANRLFTIKMGLLMLAGGNAALFHGRGGVQRLDLMARLQTVVSLCLWLAVLGCGRFIAYV